MSCYNKAMKDRIFSIVEYLLSALWIYGGFNTLFADPLNTPSPIYDLLAGQEAIYFYGAFFLLNGLALLFAKVFKRKKIHLIALAGMYLTCIYVLILAYLIGVLSTGSLLTVVSGVAAAVCWMRWKFKTEYLNPEDFRDVDLRDDTP